LGAEAVQEPAAITRLYSHIT